MKGFAASAGQYQSQKQKQEHWGSIEMEEVRQLIGRFFEETFIRLLTQLGFKEGEDYQDLRTVGYRHSMPKGYPDFYFPKTRTFVEIKSISKSYNEHQKRMITKLKKEGYNIKTLYFQVHVLDSLDDIKGSLDFVNELKGC